ncbi:TPA: hypothetical protein N0F65_006293 [Lagenidium giganteum]|uniref:GIY-YIG domain-containing protein n=1 Tax=Lagenidium giganteum TaxID=4803 RepID=A0AAV2YDJ1_9STRA|nr:TPA: hypothetical protein N0F65_006293 [Lagenidium giganteum]
MIMKWGKYKGKSIKWIHDIYKIVCGKSDDVYIGSTINELRVRWQEHKNGYKKYKNGLHRKMTIHPLFDQYGVDNFKIMLIEKLLSKEQLWINKLRCVNTAFAYNPMRGGKGAGMTVMCECGGRFAHSKKKRHERSKKHQKFVNRDV